jgi:hypothetical protein
MNNKRKMKKKKKEKKNEEDHSSYSVRHLIISQINKMEQSGVTEFTILQ